MQGWYVARAANLVCRQCKQRGAQLAQAKQEDAAADEAVVLQRQDTVVTVVNACSECK